MHDFESTYAQPSTFKNTPANSNKHAQGLTHAHIYIQTREYSVPDMLLALQHIESNIRNLTDPNHNPNPSLQIYMRQTKILTRNLTKKAQEIA